MKWCSNKKAGIFFDTIPAIGIRYSLPFMEENMKKKIEKFPFVNKKTLHVLLEDYTKTPIKNYKFTIPKGYCFDGATIPRFFWRIIGPNTDNKFLVPALIHDFLCENHHCIDNDRKFSSEVFNALLEGSNVNGFKRFLMKNSVDMFQRFCKWQK